MKNKMQLRPTDTQHRRLYHNLIGNRRLFQALEKRKKEDEKSERKWEDLENNIVLISKSVEFEVRGSSPVIFDGADLKSLSITRSSFVAAVLDGRPMLDIYDKNGYITQSPKIEIRNGRIHIPKVGKVAICDIKRNLTVENINEIIITFEDGYWFITFEN